MRPNYPGPTQTFFITLWIKYYNFQRYHVHAYIQKCHPRYPNTDDYKKMARVMKYIQGNIGIPLILSIDNSGDIKWCVDAAFAVHKDMMRHTGGFMTTVIGGAYFKSSKKN